MHIPDQMFAARNQSDQYGQGRYYSLWQWQGNITFFYLRAEKYKFGKADRIVVKMAEGMFYSE